MTKTIKNVALAFTTTILVLALTMLIVIVDHSPANRNADEPVGIVDMAVDIILNEL